jgi:hypothetical protein
MATRKKIAPVEDPAPVVFSTRIPLALKLELEDVLHARKRAGLEPWTTTAAVEAALKLWISKNRPKP